MNEKKEMKFWSTKNLAIAAAIGAVYGVLTMIIPFSYGPLQIRVSEAMTILPVFTPAAIPGLFVGCIVANLISPCGLVDIIFGSLATLVAAWGTYLLRRNKLLALLPPVIINGIVVGGVVLYYFYGVDFSLFACIALVMAGEAVSCYAIGYPLTRLVEKKYKGKIESIKNETKKS